MLLFLYILWWLFVTGDFPSTLTHVAKLHQFNEVLCLILIGFHQPNLVCTATAIF